MNLYPEGSAVSTASDMAAYMRWLTDPGDGRVLLSSSKAELFAQQYTMSEELPGMGYTWNRKIQNGQMYFDKKGETLNFYSRIALFPNEKTGVFLSMNTYLPPEHIDNAMCAAADAVYGQSQYGKGRSTFDIAGVYKNNWSSTDTMEKIIRYLVPGKMLCVEGSMEKGFSIGGQALTPVGEDEYISPMGQIKFLKRDGQILIATQSAITYAIVPFWQAPVVQASIPALSLILLILAFICSMVAPLRGRTKPDARLIACLVLEGALLCALCGTILYGITSFRLLDFETLVRVLGWSTALAALMGALWTRTTRGLLCFTSALWALSSLFLIAQMGWMHILI
jgi:hypothetical protein